VLNGVGLIIVSQGTARWLRHRPGQPLLLAGIAVNALTGALALLFGITGWGGLLGLIPWMFLYCAMIGCTNPTAAGLTMLHFGHAAGMTSALIGIFLYSGATVAALAMGSFNATTPVPQTALMCFFGVAALVTYLLFRPREAR
jgi:DHA1 family bicyclomycin/chloramphenicol resistance-like MFS transporter